MTDRRNRLSDPEYAAFAWDRYRRVMRWMLLFTVLSAAAALIYLDLSGVPFTIHLVIATVAGVSLTVLLGTALMGLVFLSSGTGHDIDAATHEEDRS